MSSVPLLSAPGGVAGKPSRSASGVVAKPMRGFLVFRVEGYSWTKALPGGERITSPPFNVGGRLWQIDYYPNGTDDSSTDDSAGIALYLRMHNTGVHNTYGQTTYNNGKTERVRAQYKFSLLDLDGNAAYELPAETGIFKSPIVGHNAGVDQDDDPGCGYASFITKEDLEKRRDSLLKEDCLAIRCDVGIMVVTPVAVAPVDPMAGNTRNYGGYGRGRGRGGHQYGYWDEASPVEEDYDGGSHKAAGRRSEPDDKEYIRRCLSSQRQ